MIWNGVLCCAPFFCIYPSVQLGNLQPIDPYVANTQYKEAWEKIKAGMLPSVLADASYQGKLYNIPLVEDVCCFIARSDYLAAVGYADVPATWDQVVDAAKKVTVRFAKDKVFGWAPAVNATHRYMVAIHQALSPPEELFTKDGNPNVASAGFKMAMEYTKKLLDAGTIPAGWEAWDYPEGWKKGKVAMAVNQHSMGCWGGMIWGYDKLRLAAIPKAPGIKKAGTMFWASGFELYTDAPYPQETVDFVVWLVNPDNPEGFPMTCLKAGKLYPYTQLYEKLDKTDVTVNWTLGPMEALAGATAPPKGRFGTLSYGIIPRNVIKYLKGEMTLDETINKMVAEMDAEMKR